MRGGDEVAREGQDGNAQTVQSVFLIPPKASILKEKTKGGRRDNNKRDKDEDSDVEDSQGGRKKEGRTADYLDSITKKPAMVSPAKLLALTGTPATGFAPAGYFPYGGTPWPMMPTNIDLRERPTIKDLCVSKIDVPSLVTF